MSSLGISQDSQWIPLMDYAMKKGISLSTLRRHIKSNKINYRIESGRYLLLDDDAAWMTPVPMPTMAARGTPTRDDSFSGAQDLQLMVLKMKAELQRAHEEIAELKTLIAFYEERIPQPRLDV